MDIETFKLFGASTFVIPGIFFVGFGKVLVARPYTRVIAVVLAIALAIGAWGAFAGRFSPLVTIACVLPAYQYLVFRALYAMFTQHFGRSPQTAVFNFASGILADRLFNVGLLIVATLIPLYSVAYLLRP